MSAGASRPVVGGLRDGVVVVDKPSGLTSHQVVARARRLLGTRKVGHAGTLDPMATGVLVLGAGRATRLLGYLTLTDKEYRATIRLGQATLTDDAEGEPVAAGGAAGVLDAAIEAVMAGLRGSIQQVPSSVSAIKVDGVRAYSRVRAGDDVTLPARTVTVRRFEVVARRDVVVGDAALVDLDVVVECSSGTYVRALARDLGAGLGIGGHLTALCRTRAGPFVLAEAHRLDGSVLPLTDTSSVARRCFPTMILSTEEARAVRFGRRLTGRDLPDRLMALFDPAGEFLALYRAEGADAVPEAVFVG